MAAVGHILLRCLSATNKQGQFSVLWISLSVEVFSTELPAQNCFEKAPCIWNQGFLMHLEMERRKVCCWEL